MNKDLNPSAYVVFLQEISVELSEIYVQLFDLKNDEITSGAAKRTKANIKELNSLAKKCIKVSSFVTESVYKAEFEERFHFV